MALTDNNKHEYSTDELAILEGVIDYADRMIYEDKTFTTLGGFADTRGYVAHTNAPVYKQLRRSAYAKTVLIDTEQKGRIEIRLSPTEATCPPVASYCTPHSPVGRLATICHPGFEGRSKLWGDYRVIEVRSFDRYGGPEFEPNVRNFLHMGILGDDGKDAVSDLRAFIRKKRPVRPAPPAEDAHPQVVYPDGPAIPPEVVEVPPAEIQIAGFTVEHEPEEADAELEIDADEDWNPDEPPVKQEEYYGLSERFFTHQTLEQNQIIARSPVGAMFVEGIAGSGKTSAALGRTKMLTTFNTTNVIDKQQFVDVVGQDQDYWSADFAGQFSQESCVGFVRTGELIQYLQETCRRIDLPNLPVHEYKELQTKLRDYRRLTSSAVPGRRWAGLAEVREAHAATTMGWLHAADQAIARRLAARLIEALPSTTELAEPFEPDARAKVVRVAKIALEHMQKELQEVAAELTHVSRSSSAFALDRLAVRLLSKVEDVRKRVMGAKVIWSRVADQTIFASDENALARMLVERKAALYFATGQRLVFIDANGPIDPTLQMLSTTGDPLVWSVETQALMLAGKVIVREPSGKNAYAVTSDVNHLFMRLLPEATELIYSSVDGVLRRLPRMLGWGRAKLPMLPVDDGNGDNGGNGGEGRDDEDRANDEVDAMAEVPAPGQPRNTTPDAMFRRIIHRRLSQLLTGVADQYLDTLEEAASQYPDAVLANRLHAQLSKFKLADEDIDLLLCLSHVMGRGLKQGGLRRFHEPKFYQAVFIDEVQDFTEQQVFLMVEQCNPKYRAVTVVGDISQKLHHGSSIDVKACFPGQSVPHVMLTENLRQADSPGLALFSACYRAVLQGGDRPSAALIEKTRTEGARLVQPRNLDYDTDDKMDALIVDALTSAKPHQTVAVLFPDSATAAKTYKRLEERLRERMVDAEFSEKVNLARRRVRHFADVANSKGLEFDLVLLVGVDRYDLRNATHINRLYVGITRARQSLVLLSGSKALPLQLASVRTLYQTLTGQP
jgi:UvrD-like helicase C-terminal domain